MVIEQKDKEDLLQHQSLAGKEMLCKAECFMPLQSLMIWNECAICCSAAPLFT